MKSLITRNVEIARSKYRSLPVTVKSSVWFTLCSFLQRGMSFLTVPIFTRLMSTTEYGTVTLFISWLEIVTVITTLQVPYGAFYNGMIRYRDDKEGYTTSVLSLTTLLVFLWGIIALFFHNTISDVLGIDSLLIAFMLIEIYYKAIFTIWITRQKYEYNYRIQTILSVFSALFAPTLGVVLVYLLPDKILGRILSFMITGLITGTYALISILKKNKKLFNWEYWKFTILFCIPLIPHYLSQTVLSQSDRLMINAFCGTAAAGIYGLSHNISFVSLVATQAINNSFLPWLYQRMEAKEFSTIRRLCNLLVIMVAAIVSIVTMIIPEIVYIMGGTNYQQAIYVMPPLAVSVYFIFVYGLFCNIQLFFEKTKQVLFASLGSGILNVILNYYFIQKFGYIAAGYTTLFCYIVLAVLHYVIMRIICKNKRITENIYDVKMVMIISGLVLCISVLEMILYSHIIIRYALLGICSIVMIIKRRVIIETLKIIKRK